jgi:hypothetical protein
MLVPTVNVIAPPQATPIFKSFGQRRKSRPYSAQLLPRHQIAPSVKAHITAPVVKFVPTADSSRPIAVNSLIAR